MWALYGLFGAWLLLLAGAVAAAWWFQSHLGIKIVLQSEPGAVVIAPIKGAGRHLPDFVARLRGFSYGRYRVIAVVESDADPALPILRAEALRPGPELDVRVAGLSVDEGQKVHNLRHALASLRPGDEIVAFIDADTRPQPDWLTRVVRPVMRGVDIATGHRWLVPTGDDVPSALAAAATNSVVGVPRLWTSVWGGTFALSRQTVDRIRLDERWRGSVVDDVQLTRVARELGLRILAPRNLVVPCLSEHSLASALAYGRRQYFFMRWYLPHLWAVAALFTTLPILAGILAVAAAATGDAVALGTLAAVLVLWQFRAFVRERIAAKLWGGDPALAGGALGWVTRWLPPAWVALHALAVWSTAFSRRLVWAGIGYDFQGHQEVRVVRRRPAPQG